METPLAGGSTQGNTLVREDSQAPGNSRWIDRTGGSGGGGVYVGGTERARFIPFFRMRFLVLGAAPLAPIANTNARPCTFSGFRNDKYLCFFVTPLYLCLCLVLYYTTRHGDMTTG
jgi:hypothetical protein